MKRTQKECRNLVASAVQNALNVQFGDIHVIQYGDREFRVKFPQPEGGPHYIRVKVAMEN